MSAAPAWPAAAASATALRTVTQRVRMDRRGRFMMLVLFGVRMAKCSAACRGRLIRCTPQADASIQHPCRSPRTRPPTKGDCVPPRVLACHQGRSLLVRGYPPELQAGDVALTDGLVPD